MDVGVTKETQGKVAEGCKKRDEDRLGYLQVAREVDRMLHDNERA